MPSTIVLQPIFFLMLYKITLDLSYYFVIPNAGYYAVFVLNFNPLKLVESYFLLLFTVILLPKFSLKLSDLLIWLLVLLSYVPMLTIFAFQDQSRVFMYATTAFWLGISIINAFSPEIYLPPIKKSQAKAICLSLYALLGIISLFVIYEYMGFFVNMDISKIYDVRSEFVEAELPLKGYYFHWLATAFNPIFFAVYVVRKRWIFVLAIVCLQILIVSVVGLRSYLFILPFVLGLMLMVKQKSPLNVIVSGLTAMIFLGLLFYCLAGNVHPFLFLTARWLFVPAEITFYYYDFFSTHELIPFAYIFKYFLKIPYFFDYPYDVEPAYLIGSEYFGQPELGAVGGILADAYMNLGLLGLVVWGMGLVMILKLLDCCSRGVDKRIAVAALAMASLSLPGTYLVRTLITGGLLLSILVLYLLREQRNELH